MANIHAKKKKNKKNPKEFRRIKYINDNPYLPRHCWLLISWEIWTNTASTHVVHCDINIHHNHQNCKIILQAAQFFFNSTCDYYICISFFNLNSSLWHKHMKMRDKQERDKYTVCSTWQTNSYRQQLTVFKLGESERERESVVSLTNGPCGRALRWTALYQTTSVGYRTAHYVEELHCDAAS